jgi:hypothetical protein
MLAGTVLHTRTCTTRKRAVCLFTFTSSPVQQAGTTTRPLISTNRNGYPEPRSGEARYVVQTPPWPLLVRQIAGRLPEWSSMLSS